jgi:DNA-binding transcriptional LysR family regulator
LPRSVLADFERTRDEIAAVASGAAGRVRVGAMVVATPVLLIRAIDLLKARSVQTTVLVDEDDLTRLLPRLRLGELDLLVARLETGYSAPDLETDAFYDEPMCIVTWPNHELAARKKVTWADLAQHAWVMPPPGASSRFKLEQMY